MGERIVAAACLYRDQVVTLPPPARHHTIIRHVAEQHPEDKQRLLIGAGGEQGFMTNAGRYVGRREAMRIAIEAGQIDRKRWSHPLYSEDLW